MAPLAAAPAHAPAKENASGPASAKESTSEPDVVDPALQPLTDGTTKGTEVASYADAYAPGPLYCTYGLRVLASCVPYVLKAQAACPRERHYYTHGLRVPASACRTYRVRVVHHRWSGSRRRARRT